MRPNRIRPKRLALGAATVAALLGCATLPDVRSPSAQLTRQLEREIQNRLDERRLRPLFARYQTYSNGRLDASAGTNTWRDKTGNCRLRWYDSLMRDQLHVPGHLERFSRELHETLLDERDGLRRALALAAQRLDVRAPRLRSSESARDYREVLRQALVHTRRGWERAVAPLTEAEQQELVDHLYDLTTKQIQGNSHGFRDRKGGRRLCDLLEKMDRAALYEAATALIPLTRPDRWKTRASWPARPQTGTFPGVEGELCEVIETPAGLILVGGPGPNRYDLDALPEVALVLDVGGDDFYAEGTLTARRPVLILMDLGGNDTYRGEKPGIQGGALLGVSLLADFAGNDTYEARDVAQGACVGGIGLLLDFGGDDTYRAWRRAQGSAMAGIAFLLDRAGDDSYRAALYAQGFGGPLGFGVLEDVRGSDQYYAGGMWKDGYDDSPGYDGWSQGVGAGMRGSANGGIGLLLEGAGDDLYECDYFSHGGGYWFAVGIARDFGGNDQRLGATRLAWDGSERAEKRFLRWGVGWQAHYGLGFVLDDEGNDTYGGDIVGLAFSWDIGVAGLLDFAGNDHYQLTYGGQGHQAAFGILYDYGGDDTYGGKDYGGAPTNITYHPLPDCGGNFAFSINVGGNDTYGGEHIHNVVQERGSPGGFFIDRDQPGLPGVAHK